MRRAPARLTPRCAVLGAVLGAVALQVPASAAPSPRPLVLLDRTDDTMPMTDGDLASVTFTTSGRLVAGGGQGEPEPQYVPERLVVTLRTADPIDTGGTTEYEVDSRVKGCDNGFDFWFTPGVPSSAGGGCSNGSGSELSATGLVSPPVVGEHTVTFVFPFSAFPGRQIRPGTTISGIRAFTALVDPVTGFVGPYVVTGGLANDELRTDRVYRVG